MRIYAVDCTWIEGLHLSLVANTHASVDRRSYTFKVVTGIIVANCMGKHSMYYRLYFAHWCADAYSCWNDRITVLIIWHMEWTPVFTLKAWWPPTSLLCVRSFIGLRCFRFKEQFCARNLKIIKFTVSILQNLNSQAIVAKRPKLFPFPHYDLHYWTKMGNISGLCGRAKSFL